MRDLILVPIYYRKTKEEDWWLGNNRLYWDRDEYIDYFWDSGEREFPKVVNDKPIPEYIRYETYTDEGCVEKRKNVVDGKDLTYFLAGDIHKIPDNLDICLWNKAILAFLKNLPKDNIVVMEWH